MQTISIMSLVDQLAACIFLQVIALMAVGVSAVSIEPKSPSYSSTAIVPLNLSPSSTPDLPSFPARPQTDTLTDDAHDKSAPATEPIARTTVSALDSVTKVPVSKVDTSSPVFKFEEIERTLRACHRLADVETLRYCTAKMANLAVESGHEIRTAMIRQKAHVWLAPLILNQDLEIRYYACLAIVALATNKETENEVIGLGLLNLVSSFMSGQDPVFFAETAQVQPQGNSKETLKGLVPLLESRIEEVRDFVCWHFTAEAFIKSKHNLGQIFREIGAVEPLKRLCASPLAAAERACQALELIGEPVPARLSPQVPLWGSEDVIRWLDHVGVQTNDRRKFKALGLDGDMLLQLDEQELIDSGIKQRISRMRILRELDQLKRTADYSSVDKTDLNTLLSSEPDGSNELRRYLYPLLKLGVNRYNLLSWDVEELLDACKVSNPHYRSRLFQVLKQTQAELYKSQPHAKAEAKFDPTAEESTGLDAFISYRRSTGSHLASLLKAQLELRGYNVFIDVQMGKGNFDQYLVDRVKSAKNLILVLTPHSLDRCMDDSDGFDWVHKEITTAYDNHVNVIPVLDGNSFVWPKAADLPEDMRYIMSINGVRWVHDYQGACMDKLERFMVEPKRSNENSGLRQSTTKPEQSSKLKSNENEPLIDQPQKQTSLSMSKPVSQYLQRNFKDLFQFLSNSTTSKRNQST